VPQQASGHQVIFEAPDSRGCRTQQLRELNRREKWMAANEMQELFAGPAGCKLRSPVSRPTLPVVPSLRFFLRPSSI
jgi:hypothetical protein